MEDGEWRVSIRPSADHEIDALDDSVRREAAAVITDLKDDPFPSGSIPLRATGISIASGSTGKGSASCTRCLQGAAESSLNESGAAGTPIWACGVSGNPSAPVLLGEIDRHRHEAIDEAAPA